MAAHMSVYLAKLQSQYPSRPQMANQRVPQMRIRPTNPNLPLSTPHFYQSNIDLQLLLDEIKLLLSSVFTLLLAVLLSGDLWARVLGLSARKGQRHYAVSITGKIFVIRITGDQVVAGFTSYIVSLLIVGMWFSGLARAIYIENIHATQDIFEASQLLAASLSLALAIVVSSVKIPVIYIIEFRQSVRSLSEPTPEERVQALIKDEVIEQQLNPNIREETPYSDENALDSTAEL